MSRHSSRYRARAVSAAQIDAPGAVGVRHYSGRVRERSAVVSGAGVARRAGIRQVAELAGVSMSTVSNVLNSPDVVSVDTRRRVEDAMVSVGYVRNRAARQLRGAPSITAGCLLLDSANPFFAEM